jgi:hypothetical protein
MTEYEEIMVQKDTLINKLEEQLEIVEKKVSELESLEKTHD